MSLPPIQELTTDELRALLTQVSAMLDQRLRDEAATAADLRTKIGNSITNLNALIGPVDAPAGVDSLNAVQKFSDEDMAGAAGLAFRLCFVALDNLATSVRDIAEVVAADND